jgi:hypothetical protein
MRLHRIFGLALALAALPAIAAAQETTYDFDKTAPFAQFKTYSWKDGTPTKNQLVDNRLVAAIDAQLAAKGFRRDDAAPDVFVLFHMAFDEQKDISSYAGPVRRLRIWLGSGRGSTSTTSECEILVGTLAIDIIDAKKKAMAWRGLH